MSRSNLKIKCNTKPQLKQEQQNKKVPSKKQDNKEGKRTTRQEFADLVQANNDQRLR